MSPLRWTTRSTRSLAAELARQGRPQVSADTVGSLLRSEGFSPQGNAKTVEGKQHPDRDAQSRYINEQVKAHQGTVGPVISVDTKNEDRARAWKAGLAALALETGRGVTVCHFPPGTSKWPETVNKRIRDIRQILGQSGHVIQPAPDHLASLDDLYKYATVAAITRHED
jgi:hypothetical protein